MNAIQVPEISELNEKSQSILGGIKKALGMVPNIYATLGYSSNALESYLEYDKKAGSASFNKKELEAIKLAVSEVNQCQYCLAAHTAIAKMNGITQAETLELRAGYSSDQKLNTLAKTAREISEKRGVISAASRSQFFNAGFNHADFVELISAVNAVSLTNYLHNATEIPVDFPAAEPLILVNA